MAFCLIVGNRCLSARGKLYMLIQGEEVTCKKVRTGEFKALQVHVKDCGKIVI